MEINQKEIIGGVAIFLVVSILFTFLGIYDSNEMSFVQGFLFWASTIGAGTVTGLMLIKWIFKGRFRAQSVPVKLILLSSISSLPVVVVLAAHSGGLSGQWPVSNWFIQYALTIPISLMINSVGYLSLKGLGYFHEPSELMIQNDSSIDLFLKRLPVKYHSAELYAVSSEDHYIRVHTDCGEELILMRLSDVLRELSSVDGLQTHRSWWVARNGVADSKSKSGKYSLILKSGSIAPVSRSFLKSVRGSAYL